MAAADSFVAMRGVGFDLAVDATRVLRIVAEADWDGPAAFDIDALVDGAAGAERTRRILALSGPLRPFAISTRREIHLRSCPSAELAPLPAVLWPVAAPPLLTRVAELPDQPPLVVLSVDALEIHLFHREERTRTGAEP